MNGHDDTEDLPPIPTTPLSEDMPIRKLVEEAYQNSAAHGFHAETTALNPLERLGKMMLMVTELAEAAEAERDGVTATTYEHKVKGEHGELRQWTEADFAREVNGPGGRTISLGKPLGINSEWADVVIRVFDEVGRRGETAEFVKVLIQKLLYNRTRPIKHGKSC